MKLAKKYNEKSKMLKRQAIDDMKYLQKKISGRSVYKNLGELYLRKPKHRNLWYQY